MLNAWLSRMQNESHRAILDMTMFNLPNLFAMHRPPMLILGAEDDVLVPAFLVRRRRTPTASAPHLPRHGPCRQPRKEWPLVAATLRDWLDELKP